MPASGKKTCATVLLALAAGCADEPLAVRLDAVEPATVVEGQLRRIRVRGRFTARIETAFDDPSSSSLDASCRVRLGEVRLPVATLDPTGLEVDVPGDFAPGVFDLTVIDPLGRVASLPRALEVVSRDASLAPSALQFEPLGPQQAGAAFTATLRALDASGTLLTAYSGTVALEDHTGTLVPRRVSLVDGSWQGPLEVRLPARSNRLRATLGTLEALSTDFAVSEPPASLQFLSPPPDIAAGDCSPIDVAALDADGAPPPLPLAAATVTVSLEPDLAQAFADPGCTVPLALPALDASARISFFVRGTTAVQLALSVSSDRFGTATQPLRIHAGAAASTRFVTPPRAVEAGRCSEGLAVQVEDAFGNPVVTSEERQVALSLAAATDGVALFAEPGCDSPSASAPLAPLAQRARFHLSGTVAGSYTVRAAAPGATAAEQAVTIVGGAPASLAFSAPASPLEAGACSGPIEVQVRDAFGNPVPLAGPATVSLAASPSTALELFADPACQVLGSSVPMVAGQTLATFSLRGRSAGAFPLSALLPPLAPAQRLQQIIGKAAKALAFLTPPQSLVAGECSAAVLVSARDEFGNPATLPSPLPVDLAAGPGLAFFGDPACASAIAAVSLAPGEASAEFWFAATLAGEPVIRAAASGLEAEQTERVTPASPARLAIVSPPHAVAAGTCSPEVVVQVRDRFDNRSPAPAAASIALTAVPDLGIAFFAGPGCEGVGADRVPLAQGASETALHFAGRPAGDFRLVAALASLTPAEQLQTVLPGPPHHLAFLTPAQHLAAGECSAPAALELRDEFENPSPSRQPLDVLLAAAPADGFSFFADDPCSLPVGAAAQIAPGSAALRFRFSGTRAGAAELVASAAGVGGARQPVSIEPGPAAKLAFLPIASPQREDRPFSVTLQARDAWDNPTPSFGLPAELSLAPAGGDLRCTSGCQGPDATTTPLSSGSWSGSVAAAPLGTWQLAARAGDLSGTSAPFEVIGDELAPRAILTALPPVLHASRTALFDAGATTDPAYPTSALTASWDLLGATTGPAPWTAWGPSMAATQRYLAEGSYDARLAVRNPAGVVGYAVRRVRVVPSSELCLVDTASDVDDGGDCVGAKGADGKLSLREAIRFANEHPAHQAIGFSGVTTLDSTEAYPVRVPLEIHAPPGVVLRGAKFELAAGSLLLSGVDLSGTGAGVRVAASAALEMLDCRLHDGAAVQVAGRAALTRVRMERCDDACLILDGDAAQAKVHFSSLLDSPRGIALERCGGAEPALVVQSTALAGLSVGLDSAPGCTAPVRVRHATFDQNGTGLQLAAGAAHELRNSIFSRHTVRAVDLGAASFAARDGQLLFANLDDGMLAGDPRTLRGDPRFLDADGRDYRILAESPARDSATDLSIDVNGPAPGSYGGPAPDRGAEEGW